MKNVILCACASAMFLLSGCDKLKEQRYSTTILSNFNVSVSDNSGALDVDVNQTLSSLINAALAEHKDDIQSYELVQIKYKVWEYSGDASATFSGNLGIGNMSATLPGVSYEFSDISLKAGVDDPAQVLMSFTSSEIDKIEQYFLDTDGLKLFLSGNVSHAPMTFLLQVQVDIDAITKESK
ncbi:MAG: hypothetical protein JNM00_02305 [Flavobacteriales bacterium]|nr:hypothetical protein [Flavobacteriales bacterium]